MLPNTRHFGIGVVNMDLIIFYANGQTFKFSQVTNLKIEGDKVDFDYYGLSRQWHRHASFTGVVGYSTENKPTIR